MNTPSRLIPSLTAGLLALLTLSGCGEDPQHDASAHEAQTEAPRTDPDRVAIPPVVRRNLGITFAEARYRPVAATIQLPGHFEVLPAAAHHYPLPAAGRVTVHVAPLDPVRAGQLLLSLEAPAWRELQQQLVEAQATLVQTDAAIARARAAQTAAGTFAEQGEADEGTNVFRADLEAAQADRRAARDRFDQLISRASTLTGVPQERLRTQEDDTPYWRRLDAIPLRAVDAGIVRDVDAATGTWVAANTEVVHVLNPQALRFRGRALQADLIDQLRDGQGAAIHPPEGRGEERRGGAIAGTIRLGVTGDPQSRTVDVFIDLPSDSPSARPAWVRPQVAALASVTVAGDQTREELAIPERALIQDGLETVFFRRDPRDPDTVIRTVADLGPSDGQWVVVYSGLAAGDQVVIDGTYQLKLATTGQDVEAGHFHADGTWHSEDH